MEVKPTHPNSKWNHHNFVSTIKWSERGHLNAKFYEEHFIEHHIFQKTHFVAKIRFFRIGVGETKPVILKNLRRKGKFLIFKISLKGPGKLSAALPKKQFF